MDVPKRTDHEPYTKFIVEGFGAFAMGHSFLLPFVLKADYVFKLHDLRFLLVAHDIILKDLF